MDRTLHPFAFHNPRWFKILLRIVLYLKILAAVCNYNNYLRVLHTDEFYSEIKV